MNGKHLQVTPNLHAFLDEAREHKDLQMHYLWIDQLCIDQNSIVERNAQVAIMDLIYKNAYKTVIWLGAIELPTSEGFEYWSSILRKPYWTRLWVVQEIAFSINIAIMLQGQLVPWPAFLDQVSSISSKDESLASLPAVQLIRRLQAVNHLLTEGKLGPGSAEPTTMVSWNILMDWFRDLECSDPRDKIYALRALVKPEERVDADYGISVEMLFHQMCTLMYSRYPMAKDYAQGCKRLLQSLKLSDRPDIFVKVKRHGHRPDNDIGPMRGYRYFRSAVYSGVEAMVNALDFDRMYAELIVDIDSREVSTRIDATRPTKDTASVFDHWDSSEASDEQMDAPALVLEDYAPDLFAAPDPFVAPELYVAPDLSVVTDAI